MKTCKQCKERKLMVDFYKHETNADGRSGVCKICRCAANRLRYATDPAHKRRHNKLCTKRTKERYHSDPIFRIKNRLRVRMNLALDGKLKHDHTVALLGCSIEYFKGYIAGMFRTGMRWGKRGSFEIDHIIPLKAFDLTDEFQQRKAFHYSNCQPLFQHENRRKGAKYDPDDLEEYLSEPL